MPIHVHAIILPQWYDCLTAESRLRVSLDMDGRLAERTLIQLCYGYVVA
jgi:hypothetical protein